MPDKSRPVTEITPNIKGFNVLPPATTPAVVPLIAEVLISLFHLMRLALSLYIHFF